MVVKRGSFHVAGKKIRTASDVSSQVDTGGGEMDKVRAELVWGIAGAAGVTAAGLGARAAIKTGVPTRVANWVTGQKVVVHGSPTKGLRQIDPRLNNNQLPEQNVVFGWDPQKVGAREQITHSAGKYTFPHTIGKRVEGLFPPLDPPSGSVYIAKFKKSDIVTPPHLNWSGQVVSKSSAKVVQEIPVAGKTFAQVDAELQRQLRRAGAAAKPNVSRSAAVVNKTTKKIHEMFMTQAQKDAARRKKIR